MERRIDVPFLFSAVQKWTAFSISSGKEKLQAMKKILKRFCTGLLTLATALTALPTAAVHASETQYWTESAERVGIVEKVTNDDSIGSTFNEGHMTVEGEDAFCVDININFRNGYKTRADASTRMTQEKISDVSLGHKKIYRDLTSR